MLAAIRPLAGLLSTLALFGLAIASCSSEVHHPATQDAALKVAATDTATGPCLLLYNSSQVDGPTDGCCYYLGGVNTCNTAMTCSALSGPECCLLYATDATTGGDRHGPKGRVRRAHLSGEVRVSVSRTERSGPLEEEES